MSSAKNPKYVFTVTAEVMYGSTCQYRYSKLLGIFSSTEEAMAATEAYREYDFKVKHKASKRGSNVYTKSSWKLVVDRVELDKIFDGFVSGAPSYDLEIKKNGNGQKLPANKCYDLTGSH